MYPNRLEKKQEMLKKITYKVIGLTLNNSIFNKYCQAIDGFSWFLLSCELGDFGKVRST